MGFYKIEGLAGLTSKIKRIPKEVNKVASNVLNRAATFTADKSVDEILSTHNLKRDYVKSKFATRKRASPNSLSAIVAAEDRRTLFSRYPHSKVENGVSVSIKKGVTKTVKRGFIARNLRGSFATGVAVTNKDYVSYLETSETRSKFRAAKLAKARRRLAEKPKGWKVLHAVSINQLFSKNRDKIKEPLKRFMVKEFFKELRNKR